MKHIPQDYPDRIRRLRARLGLSQKRLAELLGVSFASVNRWENGQARPNRLAWGQILRLEIDGPEGLRKPPLTGGSSQVAGALFAAEGKAAYRLTVPPEPHEPGKVDFTAPPEIVRLAVEAERLTYGHLFSPALATETSLIDPLPHQRIAVYDHM
ncbi:MAG: helix-turn-helix domain-containing protein, partial [Desulfotomaculales bacterium]